jgi:hypothetical protein
VKLPTIFRGIVRPTKQPAIQPDGSDEAWDLGLDFYEDDVDDEGGLDGVADYLTETPHPDGRVLKVRARGIHCDDRVIHRPQACLICDEFGADLQTERFVLGVNYTGESDPAKAPCPATLQRPLDAIYAWHGNVPVTPEKIAQDLAWVEEVRAAVREFDRQNHQERVTGDARFHAYTSGLPPAIF